MPPPAEALTLLPEPHKHGEILSPHERWCESCGQEHDMLYVCPSYPPELQDDLATQQRQLLAMLADPEMAHGRGGLVHAELLLRRLWAGVYG